MIWPSTAVSFWRLFKSILIHPICNLSDNKRNTEWLINHSVTLTFLPFFNFISDTVIQKSWSFSAVISADIQNPVQNLIGSEKKLINASLPTTTHSINFSCVRVNTDRTSTSTLKICESIWKVSSQGYGSPVIIIIHP